MKKLLVYLKEYEKETILAPLFKLLEASFELLVPLVMAAVIDTGIRRADRPYIVKMCLVLVLLGVVGLACSITAQFFAAKAAVGFAEKLRHALFGHIQKLSYTQMDAVGTSTLITRMTSDVNQAQAGVNMVLRLFLRSPFIVFGAMVMAFTIDFQSALLFAAAIPLLSLVVFGIMALTMPMYKRAQAGLDRVLGLTRENLTGVRVIRAFHKEEAEIQQFTAQNEALAEMQMRVGRLSALMNPLTYVLINLAVMALLWTGALRVESGIITQGQVVALVNYMSQILVELVKLANLIVTVTKAAACGSRIQSVLEIPAGEENPEHAEKGYAEYIEERKAERTEERKAERTEERNAKHTGERNTECTEERKAERTEERKAERTEERNAKHTGERNTECTEERKAEHTGVQNAGLPADTVVAFEHVSLTYQGAGAESLADIDFAVKRGETVGIIGGTGSGKSSLINLIPRFYNATKGRVLVDGLDVREYETQELRRKIGIVPQKAVLFQGTIRSNLLWGRGDATEEVLLEALRTAQVYDFVMGKADGLDAPVTQGGKNFSGGQKQRLTIARALVRDPEILILDDAASALDFATDAALRKALRERKAQPAVFIVSQRASSIRHADRIIVLEDGEMAGIGTHEQLLQTCAAYREIYESQYERKEA